MFSKRKLATGIVSSRMAPNNESGPVPLPTKRRANRRYTRSAKSAGVMLWLTSHQFPPFLCETEHL